MLKFGPAGNSDRFYDEGYKSTLQAPAWLHKIGLTAYEYSFGRGVSLSDDMAEKIRSEMEAHHISVSAHAPYFINLGNPDAEKRENSYRYILDSARAVTLLGGNRIVVHVGALTKLERAVAIKNCRDGLLEAYKRLDDAGLGGVIICPETMGKYSQIGDLDETLDFCLLDARMVPCIDFAHLHALSNGGLQAEEDFIRILDRTEAVLGLERARRLHMHFSTIEFTKAGEKRHHTFDEPDYGPRFEMLAPQLLARGYHGTVICECKGTQADDAAKMQKIYRGLNGSEDCE